MLALVTKLNKLAAGHEIPTALLPADLLTFTCKAGMNSLSQFHALMMASFAVSYRLSK